jgi:hypothetical protein
MGSMLTFFFLWVAIVNCEFICGIDYLCKEKKTMEGYYKILKKVLWREFIRVVKVDL